MESIRSAAILKEGISHAEIFQANKIMVSHGFFTTTGRFVDRFEAAKIAYEAGQLLIDPNGSPLISEDLWLFGSYEWTAEKGYHKLKRYIRVLKETANEEIHI